jgi:ankyrin repeat protein
MKCLGILLLACAAQAGDSAALFKAIRNDDLAQLRAGLKQPAAVNARDNRQATLLMHAAAFGSPQAMRILLDAGADVNLKNTFDATALLWAAGDPVKARMLIEAGADVKARSKQGQSPLLIAAEVEGGSEIVRLMLAKGADAKAAGFRGRMPLHAACDAGDIDSVRLLLAAGADVNQADGGGYTPLHSAVFSGNLALVKLLLEKGARVNVANRFAGQVKFGSIDMIGLTPLMYATPHGTPEMVRALLDSGANVNAVDNRGMTALMFAVSSETQNPEVVRLLLTAGADVSIKSKTGETALDWALKFNNPSVLGALNAARAPAAVQYKPPPPNGSGTDARASVEKSIALLQKSSTEFFRQSGCVGCHHQNFTALAVNAARSGGVRVDEAASAEQSKVTSLGWSTFAEGMLQRIDPPGAADMTAWSLIGLSMAGHQADATTDAMTANLAAMQRANGSWYSASISRSPIEEGNIGRTVLSLRGLQLYGTPSRKAEFDRRVSRAQAWLMKADARTTDDLAMRLLGLKWSGAAPDAITAAGRSLAAVQRGDGGWGQNPHLGSDAYATGEALYALREAGVMPGSDPAYQKGVRYLLGTRFADGSWYVRSRAPKFQPYFQSGFPFDHDQWISASATAWASAAIAGSLNRQDTASRAAAAQ